jgi:antitoxin ParD1/3/4
MATMNISLPDPMKQWVERQAEQGRYANASDYVRDLIRERYARERERATKLKALDEALAQGIADAEAGRVMPLDEAFRRLRASLNLTEERRQ